MDDELHPGIKRSLEDIESAFNIGTYIGKGSMIGIGNANQGCQVEDDFRSLHCPPNSIHVTDIAEDDFNILLTWHLLKPPP